VGDYRKLKVWEKAHQMTLSVFKDSLKFPTIERYGLAAQLRRAATSVVSNIVEGAGRQGDGDMGRFLQISRGSLFELQYQFLLARDLGYVTAARYGEVQNQAEEVGRMLQGLLTHVRRARTKSGEKVVKQT
jgi:four helix bundle protein